MKQIKNIAGRQGFTLIEILVVIGIIAILAAVVLVALNPARQFAQARDSQRTQNVSAVLDAIGQNIADNRGLFVCTADTIPLDPAPAANISSAGVDIRPCLVPTYMSELPADPTDGTNTCVDVIPGDCDAGSYDTFYTVVQAAAADGGRITITAPSTDLAVPDISATR